VLAEERAMNKPKRKEAKKRARLRLFSWILRRGCSSADIFGHFSLSLLLVGFITLYHTKITAAEVKNLVPVFGPAAKKVFIDSTPISCYSFQ
jgi:hypothetical protein